MTGCQLIVAVNPNGIIGVNNEIPWNYPGDTKRFRRLTLNTTVVMGRNTWESLPIQFKPLPRRRNIVITNNSIPEIECYGTIEEALNSISRPVWFIGGAKLYEAAMKFCDFMDITYIPDIFPANNKNVYFPPIDLLFWEAGPLIPHEDDFTLNRRIYTAKRI